MSKLKILESLIRRVIQEEKSKLTEKFMSPKLAKFAKELGKFKSYHGKSMSLLSGIAWDKIPDSEVLLKKSGDEDLRKYVNSDEYIILWFGSDRKVIDWKPTTYTKWGAKQDNSTYFEPGRVVVTQGRNFLYGYNELQNMNPARDTYEKPYNGKLSVLKLSTEMGANALIINKSALEQYSTVDLRGQRKQAKSGATALKNAADILSDNQSRYRQLIKQNKDNITAKPVTDAVNIGLKKLKSKIEEFSKINFDNLVTYSTNNGYYDKTTPVPTVKNIDLTKLNAAATLYKNIVEQYAKYLSDLKIGYSTVDVTKERTLEYISQIDSL